MLEEAKTEYNVVETQAREETLSNRSLKSEEQYGRNGPGRDRFGDSKKEDITPETKGGLREQWRLSTGGDVTMEDKVVERRMMSVRCSKRGGEYRWSREGTRR